MTPRLKRKTDQSQPLKQRTANNGIQPKSPVNWLKRLVSLIVLIGILGGVLWFLWQAPSKVECVTNLNSYCNEMIMESLKPLSNTPWVKIKSRFADQQEQILAQHDDLVAITLHRRPLHQIEITAEYAQPLFMATVDGQSWQVLSNAYLKPIEKPGLPVMTFPNQEMLNSLSDEDRQNYAYLYQNLSAFSPRCKSININSRAEITAEFENSGQVLLKIGDHQIIDKQLATLQAFLRSSTMDQDYNLLDLRFDGVAVVKE